MIDKNLNSQVVMEVTQGNAEFTQKEIPLPFHEQKFFKVQFSLTPKNCHQRKLKAI